MAAEGQISVEFRSYSLKNGGVLWVTRFLQKIALKPQQSNQSS